MKNNLDITVAKIMNYDKIIINKGEFDGILEQMRFLVYEEGDEIFDPTTNRSLGLLEKPKGRFKVNHIQQNLTILISEINRANLFNNLTNPFSDSENDIALLKTIKVGDKVKILNK